MPHAAAEAICDAAQRGARPRVDPAPVAPAQHRHALQRPLLQRRRQRGHRRQPRRRGRCRRRRDPGGAAAAARVPDERADPRRRAARRAARGDAPRGVGLGGRLPGARAPAPRQRDRTHDSVVTGRAARVHGGRARVRRASEDGHLRDVRLLRGAAGQRRDGQHRLWHPHAHVQELPHTHVHRGAAGVRLGPRVPADPCKPSLHHEGPCHRQCPDCRHRRSVVPSPLTRHARAYRGGGAFGHARGPRAGAAVVRLSGRPARPLHPRLRVAGDGAPLRRP
mmetsp:Transcript_17274/g.53626  ORF Transcript_17274/g.53626 Transcript_17274/m.53626 type:complete len:279 (-) Transcript_17274:443-1279(-)